jgi:ankyrin repeat protein
MSRLIEGPGQGRRSALARIAAAAGLAFGLCRTARAGSYDDFLRALRLDEVQTLRRLQQRGFDFNTPDESGQSPLLLALRLDSLKTAAFLIEQPGFHLDAHNTRGENALMIAALRGHVGLLRLMLRHGAEVNKPGWTPLHYAAAHPTAVSVEMVELLLEENAYIDAASPNETTPLMMAARYGHRDSVRALLEAGADVSLRNQQGLAALDFAVESSRRDVADLIVRALRARSGSPGW